MFVVALLPAPLLGAEQENSDVQVRRQCIHVAGGVDVDAQVAAFELLVFQQVGGLAVQVYVKSEGFTGIVLVGGDGRPPEAHSAGRMP